MISRGSRPSRTSRPNSFLRPSSDCCYCCCVFGVASCSPTARSRRKGARRSRGGCWLSSSRSSGTRRTIIIHVCSVSPLLTMTACRSFPSQACLALVPLFLASFVRKLIRILAGFFFAEDFWAIKPAESFWEEAERKGSEKCRAEEALSVSLSFGLSWLPVICLSVCGVDVCC